MSWIKEIHIFPFLNWWGSHGEPGVKCRNEYGYLQIALTYHRPGPSFSNKHIIAFKIKKCQYPIPAKAKRGKKKKKKSNEMGPSKDILPSCVLYCLLEEHASSKLLGVWKRFFFLVSNFIFLLPLSLCYLWDKAESELLRHFSAYAS